MIARLLPIALALALLGAPAVAQAQASDDKAEARADRKKKRLKKRLRAMRAKVLVQELGLDEDATAELLPILARHDDELARLTREARALRRTIDLADDGALDDLIDDLVANQRARWDLDEQRFAEVRKVLTPRQAARLLIVLPEIDRRILEGARKAIRGKQGRKKARWRDEQD